MTDQMQTVADDIMARAQAVIAELELLSERADSQRQAGDVAGLVETQGAIIKLDTELLTYIQQVGEMQDESLLRAEAERDALRAEVDRLRAALPKWRSHKRNCWILGFYYAQRATPFDIEVFYCDWRREGDRWRWCGREITFHATRDDAMRAAEAELGLPICEVVNG